MQLTETQETAVRQWAAEGCGLSTIQKRLQETFDLKLTYMDVRFLIIDLDIELAESPDKHSEAKAEVADDEETEADDAVDFSGEETATGSVRVTTDRIVQPGAVASGEVTFSDGKRGRWLLDQMGRLALDMPGDTGYRPSPQDIQAFQQQLQQALTPGGL